MPDTAPPRRDAEPHNRIRSCGGGDAPALGRGLERLVILGERPAQRAVEDVARRHAQRILQVGRGLGLDARPAVRVVHQHVLNGFGENGIQRRQHRIGQLGPHGVGVGIGDQIMRGVQTEHRERLCAGAPQLLGQDRRVAQRVAVDLARQRVGHPARAARSYAASSWLKCLVDVERAAESLFGSDGFVAQSRQSAQHQVDLDLSARRLRRLRFTEQPRQHGGGDAGQHRPRWIRCSVPLVAVVHLTVGVIA